MALVSVALCALSWSGGMTPLILLGLTLCGGVGAALASPAWQSIVPQLVSRPLMRPAIALNSLGVNIARAIGPAVGGILIATVGVAAAYFVDVLSYALIIAALWWWKPAPRPQQDPEPLLDAMRSGLRFALFDADLQRVLVRAFLFFIASSCYCRFGRPKRARWTKRYHHSRFPCSRHLNYRSGTLVCRLGKGFVRCF